MDQNAGTAGAAGGASSLGGDATTTTGTAAAAGAALLRAGLGAPDAPSPPPPPPPPLLLLLPLLPAVVPEEAELAALGAPDVSTSGSMSKRVGRGSTLGEEVAAAPPSESAGTAPSDGDV